MSDEEKTKEALIAELHKLRARVAILEQKSQQQESQQRAYIILNEMYQFAGLLDINGNILEANRTALDAAGADRSDIIGRPFWETPWWTGSPESQQKLRDAIPRAARGEFVRFEAEHFAGDSSRSKIIVDFSLKPIRNEAGEVIYLLPEGRDITEKKMAEEEIAYKNRELARKNEELVESYKKADKIFCALTDILSGTVLDGKYLLESKIGVGGYGAVYRATHLGLKRPVAVKIFRPSEGGATMEDLNRFRLEGITACRVNHPNAVTVLDSGISADAIAYIVMELLEGCSLAAELREKGQLSVRRSAEILIPVCNALAEAHRSGLVHRDIKPDNIFLHRTKDGEVVKVVDFGIAKFMERSSDIDIKNVTATGMIVGTPTYMSPERLQNKPYDGRSDVYSLGITMYEMLSGQVPFDPDIQGLMAAVIMHIEQKPQPLREINPAIPEAVEAIVMRALAKEPSLRPTAEELAQEFSKILARHG